MGRASRRKREPTVSEEAFFATSKGDRRRIYGQLQEVSAAFAHARAVGLPAQPVPLDLRPCGDCGKPFNDEWHPGRDRLCKTSSEDGLGKMPTDIAWAVGHGLREHSV